MSAGAFGGMATQWGTKGNLALEDDDAIIIRSNAAGAAFRNLTLTDAFHMSIEYWKRTSSLNMVQMAADEDGDFTFVIAHHDQGIHNWLDTGGLEYGTLFLRCYRAETLSPPETTLLKQDNLVQAVRSSACCSQEERRTQIDERREGVARLLCD